MLIALRRSALAEHASSLPVEEFGGTLPSTDRTRSDRDVAGRRSRRRDRAKAPRRSEPVAAVVRRVPWAGVLCATATLALHVPRLQASRAALVAHELAPTSAGEAENPTASDAADRAVRLNPGSDRLWRLRAETLLAYVAAEPGASTVSGMAATSSRSIEWQSEAERSARRAIAIEPERALNYQTLGAVLLARARTGEPGALEAASAAFDQCVERAPYNALAPLQFAFEAMRLGRADLAIGPARRAAATYAGEALPQSILGHASLAVGDTLGAVAALDRALNATWRGVPWSREEIEALRSSLHPRGE